MRPALLLALSLCACGDPACPETSRGPVPIDASEESARADDALTARDAAEAGDASTTSAPEAGARLCCQTGQNLLACAGGYVDSGPASWTCVDDAGTETAPCTQTGILVCYPGGLCQGELGAGTIVVCGM